MNLMDLFIKVGVKDEASAPIKKLTGAVGKGLATAAKVGVAAIGAASAALGAFVTQSVKAYGEYEQLVGGAKKIFDEMDYSVIAKDASEAWKTMNLSASDYLSMMNNVGATFAATMGDEKGYETARRGMQAIADYASGTGKNVNELNDKFALITRSSQSYQSIADQFSGILPATSKDFLAQAQAAGYLSTKYEQLTQVPIAEYQEAVSLMLEKGVKDLNLAGNTAAETAKTITGSLAGLKASWANFVAGLADEDADLDALFDTLLEAAESFLDNVQPVVQRILQRIGTVLTQKMPEVGKKLPKILQKLLPGLIEGATGLISGLAKALPDILLVVLQQLPALVNSALTIGKAVIDGFIEGVPKLFGAIWTALDDAMSGVDENGNQQSSYWIDLWNRMKASASDALETIKTKVDELKEPFARMSESFNTLKTHIDDIVQKIQKWEEEHHALERIFDFVSTKIQVGIYIIEGALELLNLRFQEIDMFLTGIETLFDAVKKAGAEAADWIKSHWEELSGVIGGVAKVISPLGTVAGWIGGGKGKGHAIGNDYVPYDNYPALLHRGEAVLTAREADAWRRGEGSGRQIVNNFTFNGVSQSDLDFIVGYVNREMVSG